MADALVLLSATVTHVEQHGGSFADYRPSPHEAHVVSCGPWHGSSPSALSSPSSATASFTAAIDFLGNGAASGLAQLLDVPAKQIEVPNDGA